MAGEQGKAALERITELEKRNATSRAFRIAIVVSFSCVSGLRDSASD